MTDSPSSFILPPSSFILPPSSFILPPSSLPPFPYGAVYFRKSNPPAADWERDYATAADDGMNIFRHWFLWGAIEVAPGEFDWADYDRQLELAARHGMKTIIAEMITSAPEWAYHQYTHARLETRDGQKLESSMSGSCVTGGFPGLCLDHEDYRAIAENFLRQLAARYKGHPGLGGYDLWNECNYDSRTCYCPATAERFRRWLQAKYGDLRSLGLAWKRYSFSAWEQITPPRSFGAYPHVLDWLQFRIDNAYGYLKWRAEVIRSIDSQAALVAHGIASSLRSLASSGTDDWRAAGEVQAYGFTWIAARQGDEPWKHFHAADLVRAAARGKPFWHAEAHGGDLWMQPQTTGKPRHEGRIAAPEDIRYWHMNSFMCGARGLFQVRWRSLLDGPLFGAFGPYGMDGSRTARSRISSRIARWATDPAQQALWEARPVRGDVGILFVPETQLFTYAQQEDPSFYQYGRPEHTSFFRTSLEGAYQGFFDANIQADWVHIDDLDTCDFVYLPYPVMLTRTTAEKLVRWVQAGGVLVCEGCPGYWGDGGHVGTLQPNLGLDRLFGVRQGYVEFTPDLLGDLSLRVNSRRAWGGIFLQAYEPVTAQPVGYYEDVPAAAGLAAACDHSFGKGRVRLVGSMVGAGYAAHPGNRSPAFFQDLLAFAGKVQHVRSSDERIQARLHAGPGGLFLWVANPMRQPLPVQLELSPAWGPFSAGKVLWGEGLADLSVAERTITLTAPARDVAVIKAEN